ncbi:MAG: hypothetical protein V4773_03085 [Verrucomicrobiota bacterium]
MPDFVLDAEDAPAGVVRSTLMARGLRLGFTRLAIPGGVTLLTIRPGENPMLGLQLDPAVTGEDELGVHATTPLGPGLAARISALLPADGARVVIETLAGFAAEGAAVEAKARAAELRVLRTALAGSGPLVAPGLSVGLEEALYFTLRHGLARGLGR